MGAADGPTVFFLAYEVRPRETTDPGLQGIGGAFVSGWVKAANLDDARQRAQQHLSASGWNILTTLKEAPVRAEGGSEQDRAYWQQAQADGEVFVIDAFPADPPDA